MIVTIHFQSIHKWPPKSGIFAEASLQLPLHGDAILDLHLFPQVAVLSEAAGSS